MKSQPLKDLGFLSSQLIEKIPYLNWFVGFRLAKHKLLRMAKIQRSQGESLFL